MGNTARIYFALAVSALLALTGQGLAMSRGVSAAVGQMVICTGTGPVVVHVDAEGQPTGPPHYCPDYAVSLLGALAQADFALERVPPPVSGRPDLRVFTHVQLPLRMAMARAPPAAV
ncbi:MAG: hypothetical protein AB3N15_06675 [Paracoccaceae bacterium]